MKDSEKLQLILDALDIKANKLATDLEYGSAASVYHVLNNKNSLSKEMKEKIIKAYPSVNYLFIKNGELPILLDQENTKTQMELFNLVPVEEKEYQMFKSFINMPKKIKKLEDEVEILNQKLDKIIKKLN